MKKPLLFLSVLVVCLMAEGCAKSHFTEPLDNNPPGEPVFSHATLAFESEEAMNEAVILLVEMSDAEREAWYFARNQNFLCQQDAMWAVVEELDSRSNVEQVRTCQEKYEGIFLFNHNEADADISPYIPHDVPGLALVLNAYGEVEIAGNVVNLNTLQSYDQISYARYFDEVSRGVVRSLNRLYSDTSDLKMWAESHWAGKGSDVFIRYGAHKKTLFGWNKYKTDYHVSKDYVVGQARVGRFAPFYRQVDNAVGGLWTGEMNSGTDHRCFYPRFIGSGDKLQLPHLLARRGSGERRTSFYKVSAVTINLSMLYVGIISRTAELS